MTSSSVRNALLRLLAAPQKVMLARDNFDGLHMWHNSRPLPQDAQKGQPSHPPTLSCQDSSFPEWATLRTCSKREQSWRAFSASYSCSHSPAAHRVPISVEAIRKGLVSEMWNGIIWNASTKLASRTLSTSTARALPSLSVQAPKVPPTTPVPYMDSQQLTPCAIPVWLPRDIEWSKQDGEGAARCPPCSQNAHGETVLVRCAQLGSSQPPLENG